ncbi:MAG: hypothetical protein CVU22_13980 [Betaproteobacteria bacterium HGW-Betaproteobacteria-16]|nr:MAG: hypothetical protein CVU22_13980 [Betaproteobacteria bacterium HGW-Betaproteobacteria-16]
MGRTPFMYLPLAARVSIEYLDCQSERSIAKLDAYLEHYFTVYGQACDQETRESCHYIAMRRFRLSGEAANGALVSIQETGIPSDGDRVVLARVTARPRHRLDPDAQVWICTDQGTNHLLFSFCPSEGDFQESDFVGLTVGQARALKARTTGQDTPATPVAVP